MGRIESSDARYWPAPSSRLMAFIPHVPRAGAYWPPTDAAGLRSRDAPQRFVAARQAHRDKAIAIPPIEARFTTMNWLLVFVPVTMALEFLVPVGRFRCHTRRKYRRAKGALVGSLPPVSFVAAHHIRHRRGSVSSSRRNHEQQRRDRNHVRWIPTCSHAPRKRVSDISHLSSAVERRTAMGRPPGLLLSEAVKQAVAAGCIQIGLMFGDGRLNRKQKPARSSRGSRLVPSPREV
jgi:hypothetical protein